MASFTVAESDPHLRSPQPVQISRVDDGERLYAMDFGLLQKVTGTKHPDTALPSDAAGVLRLLRQLAPVSNGLAGAALSLPGEGPLLTPAQRAAIFKALSQIPGIRALGTVSDALGRKGVAIATPWPGHGIWLTIYDPRTSRMLADGAVISTTALGQLDNPEHLAHLTWQWTYTIDAATAPALLRRPTVATFVSLVEPRATIGACAKLSDRGCVLARGRRKRPGRRQAGPGGETVKGLRFASGGPEELAFDGAGHLYGADCQDAFVFRVRDQYSMSIVAGTGVQGFWATVDPL